MINRNILFGLDRININGNDLDCKYLSAITKDSGKIRLGSPGIVREDDYARSEKTGNLFKVIFPFPASSGLNFGYIIDAVTHTIALREKCWLDDHKLMEIDELKIGNASIRKIINRVNSKGNITFLMKDKDKSAKCVLKLHNLVENFKYSMLCNHENVGGITMYEDDNLTTAFSFLKLSDCIPIFNTRRVDGIGVLIQVFGEEISNHWGQLKYSVRTAFILSNYKDNVFVVDGVTICSDRKAEKGYFQDAVKAYKRDHHIIKKEDDLPKAKAKIKPSPYAEVKFKDYELTTSYNGGNSTTGTYYYSTDSATSGSWGR